MVLRLAVIAATCLLAACSGQPPGPGEPAPRSPDDTARAGEAFAELLADHWDLRMAEDPILAEQLGDSRGRGRLPDPSLAAYEAGIDARRELLSRLGAIDPSHLGRAAALNYRLLRRELRDDIAAVEHNGKYLTMTTYWSPHLAAVRIAERARLRSEADVASYLGRLAGIDDYLEAATARLDEAVELGWTQPCEAMVGFERTYRTHIVKDPAQSVFFAPLEASDRVSETQRAEARKLIRREIVPAFKAFAAFYEERYKPNCRKRAGVGSLPGGDEFYAQAARSYTTTQLSPDEIHELGLSEVARIRAEMVSAAKRAGFESLPAFQEHLRTSPEYYPQTAEDRLEKASRIAKRIDGKLVELFTRLPRMPYDVRPIPADIAEGTTTAYYSRPAADGSRAGTYWVNTTKLGSRPLYELEALTLHEAVPGHHLQIALMQELDLPEFRRFGGFTAFTEGWALYAERLGLEIGFFATPQTDFGRLSYEMWRACRLVVDTGIHTKGWSRDDAIAFMLENTGLSRANIEREVDRYITWPAQALAYKIGELKIRELRARAEAALGEDFDLRRFHDAVLANGALPLNILDEEISAWIEAGADAS